MFYEQVCSSPTKQETQLFSVDQLSATSSLPVTHTACSLSATAQPGTQQRRVVILPARGSISPIKACTSPKRILSPHVFTSSSGSPVNTASTNCGLVDSKCVRTTSVCISSCVSQYISSTPHGSSSESDRSLSTTLQVDGILTSSSENASRHGIVSVACRESRVQETSVLSPVTSVTRLSLPACTDNHSVSSVKNMTVSSSFGCMYQSSNSVSQASSSKMSDTRVRSTNCETSLHRAVALIPRPVISGPQTVTGTRTVNVTSIRKLCPSTDTQKRNIVVKLFGENSVSLDVANVTSADSAKSLKSTLLPRSTAAENTSGVCSPVLQQSSENTSNVNVTTICQPCPSLQTINLVVTSAAKAVSTALKSSASCHSQNITQAMTLTFNGSQNNPVVVVDSSGSSTIAGLLPAENSSNVSTKSEDDSDDDSVVIVNADIVPPPSSPSRTSTKRSIAAQNVILLNHHKSSPPHAVDSKPSASKAAVTDRMEQSRNKRKSVLGTRLLESASDEGVILSASNSSKISQPSRRKSFPQRRTDTSVPQLQFCTKQWKRDVNSSHSTTASPTCKRSQFRSPKKETATDLLDKADRSTRSVLPLTQLNLQCHQSRCDTRKRKPVDTQCQSSTLPEVKRSKRLLPVKSCNMYCNKNTETSDSVESKSAAVESGTIGTSLSAESAKTSSSDIPVAVTSCTSDASAATKTNCSNDVKTTEPVADSLSELQVLGKDKRSMEMSVTNEDGVIENLVVTIIDISSSDDDDDEDDDEVEIRSISSAKLDSSEVSMPEVETSQSVPSKSLISDANGAVKCLPDKTCANSSTLASDHQPVAKSSCKTKPIQQKCRQTVQNSKMGRNVLLRRGRTPSNFELAEISKVKQLTQLHGKSNSRKRSKNDASGTVKLTKADSDSVSAAYLGPVVRLHGSKHSPKSCSIVSGVRDVDDEMAARLKHKPVVLNSSCYPTSFQLQDSVPWKCVFCHQGSSYRTLGDLFGPYYAKADISAKSDSVTCQSSPSKSRSHPAKKSHESGYTVISPNSQRRRQKLQKYVPQVVRKSPQKSLTSPDRGIPPEIWLHENCAIWTSGICLSPSGQLCGLEAAITLSLQTVYSFHCFYTVLYC